MSEENFLKEVKKFCKGCLNGDYYIQPDYNDYWDSYNEKVFNGCKWAEIFTKDFNLTVMYSRNGDYDIAFDAFEHLFECIYKASYDEKILGTESPENYIEIDWNDAFDQYYICIKNCIKDKMEMTNKAFEV
ncbi:hypothetical protein [Clostridium sp. JN-9]|uniref:hypothetical protein n=1 Tax=Clostridium sp. JN-9 TaxID=2507159 RepID=UPI000FFE1CE5|nr:hypothetical protein [Clostridium sp. JN-9]QAT40657.1 hypothetical protein EQM05_10490 [Clostridium sp. JN-9]